MARWGFWSRGWTICSMGSISGTRVTRSDRSMPDRLRRILALGHHPVERQTGALRASAGRAMAGRALGELQVVLRVHQGNVGKRLREVAGQPAQCWVVFFGKQSTVITEGGEPLKKLMCFLRASRQQEIVHQPE